jgi:hypothetical protein
LTAYKSSGSWAKVVNGILEVDLEMLPWSAVVTDVKGDR